MWSAASRPTRRATTWSKTMSNSATPPATCLTRPAAPASCRNPDPLTHLPAHPQIHRHARQRTHPQIPQPTPQPTLRPVPQLTPQLGRLRTRLPIPPLTHQLTLRPTQLPLRIRLPTHQPTRLQAPQRIHLQIHQLRLLPTRLRTLRPIPQPTLRATPL